MGGGGLDLRLASTWGGGGDGIYGGAQPRSRTAEGRGRRSQGRTPPTPAVPGTSTAVPNRASDDGIFPGQNQSGGIQEGLELQLSTGGSRRPHGTRRRRRPERRAARFRRCCDGGGGWLRFSFAASAAAAAAAADVISPLAALRPRTRTRRRRRPERRVAQLRRRRRLAALAAAAAAALRAGMKRWHLLCKTIHWRGRGALGRCKLVNFSFLAPAATDGRAAARKDAR